MATLSGDAQARLTCRRLLVPSSSNFWNAAAKSVKN
jgi:hypothetical protein